MNYQHMTILTQMTHTWQFIQTDNVVHETGGDDNFVKHRYTAPNQASVATLWTHCQLLSITVLKNCWHLLCSLRFQHNLACTWKWWDIKSYVPGQLDSHHKIMGHGNNVNPSAPSYGNLYMPIGVVKKLNSVALVHERTIPTERPPPVGEVSANFCG